MKRNYKPFALPVHIPSMLQGESSDNPEVVNCTMDVRGKYRIQNINVRGYLIYIGVNSLPDFNQPPAVFSASLPVSLAWALPGSGIVTLSVVGRYRDSYGCISQNQYPTKIILSPSGQVLVPLPKPLNVSAFPRANGNVSVFASYPTFTFEKDPADKMHVWVSSSGPPDVTVGSTYIQNIEGDLITASFGSYSPGLYYVAVAFYRTADLSFSAPEYTTVEFPEIPDTPEAVFTENITP